jgi:predicted nucleic acid-binding protein
VILVDTSVWVDYFRNRRNPAVDMLNGILDAQEPFAITGITLQELLQGAADEKEWRLLEEYLGSQRFLHPMNPMETHRRAARLFFLSRRQGTTPRSAIDCLIAQIAIEHQVPLLHKDRDYLQLARVEPELRLLPF